MSSSLYTIGLTGLQSSNARINTTGQNTTNVDTEGYSRQRTETASSPAGGVVLRDTSRLVDMFVNAQVQSDAANYAYYDTYNSMMSVADNLLSEESVALTSYINEAFDALQAANNDPTSSSLRDLAHSSLRGLIDQYHTLSDIVLRQENLANDQMAVSLAEINEITANISNLNTNILREESLSVSPANELRDQQELLAKELSEYLDVKADFLDNGLMTVHLKNGQPLVMDQNPTQIKLDVDPLNPKKISMVVDFGNHEVGLKMDGIGGSVGALVDFRTEFSDYADRTLGQHAVSIADALNVQNAKGIDGNGDFGRNLMELGKIDILTSRSNLYKLDNMSVRVTEGGARDITTDTYELTKTDAGRFAITRYDLNGNASEHQTVFDLSLMTPSSDGYYTLEGLGIDLRLNAPEEIDESDVFRFAPTENAISKLNLTAKNGQAFAFSAPIGVTTHSDNLSDAKISITSINNTDSKTSAFAADATLYPSAPHKIYFTSPSSYVIQDAFGVEIGKVDDVLQYSNLLEQAGLAGDAGFDVSISSKPKRGDEFSISADSVGPADNFNGVELVALQNKLLVGGEANLSKAYAGFVSQVGSKTAEVAGHAKSSEIIYNDSMERRDRLSAVSLDEEAVNLLKYQQSYSASAQVITAARTTFETLLGIMR